jgi:C4-dicarboxylate-specific signal transduction histidine kinase
MDFFNGEENSAVTLCHFQRKPVMQRGRLVSLGKLSAGLAHELNNPASAAKRATGQTRDALVRMRNANAPKRVSYPTSRVLGALQIQP